MSDFLLKPDFLSAFDSMQGILGGSFDACGSTMLKWGSKLFTPFPNNYFRIVVVLLICRLIKVKPLSSNFTNCLSFKTIIFSPILACFVWLTHTSSWSFTIQHRMPVFIPNDGVL